VPSTIQSLRGPFLPLRLIETIRLAAVLVYAVGVVPVRPVDANVFGVAFAQACPVVVGEHVVVRQEARLHPNGGGDLGRRMEPGTTCPGECSER
jgi:hypothetical protein